MDKRAFGVLIGVAAAAVAFWFARRLSRSDDMFIASRPEWTPPHGDPFAERVQ
jgi:hypothetical protein